MAGDPRALLRQAEQSLQKASSGWSFFGGREEKYEAAADQFIAAANAFRMQDRGKEAGEAFEKAASVQRQQLNEPDDEASTLVNAFKAYRKDDPESAVRCVEKVIAHYCSKGYFNRAAKQKEQLSNLFEVELHDNARAAAACEDAARWHEADNSEFSANKAWEKAADFLALEGKDYYKAISLYEKVALAFSREEKTRLLVKPYLLKAGICYLCTGDAVGYNKAIDRYIGKPEKDTGKIFYRYPVDGTEKQWLKSLREAVEEVNVDKFSAARKLIVSLNDRHITLLNRIQASLESKVEDFS
ncbi:TPR-like protein [Byssothecium circinans]|uniref:TPR-like protein n=1 Tax=Byssothecium circinans TaxID=147558 RepID=A0A6A5TAL9_9PLEO|nr:TPR-like protein [Byssothecium circinans]